MASLLASAPSTWTWTRGTSLAPTSAGTKRSDGNNLLKVATPGRAVASSMHQDAKEPCMPQSTSRRSFMASLAAASVASATCMDADVITRNMALAALPPSNDEDIKLCSAECEAALDSIPLVTTASGLQYRDIEEGKGPSPPIGFQVAANYVAMVPSGKVFDSSLEKKMPYIFRVGSGQVVAGLDEGILTMKVGGLRRIYVPGELSFPKGLASAPGRPRVAPNSPVIFDVKLLYVPGLEDDEE